MAAKNVTIRPAVPGDAVAIARIHRDAIRSTPAVADHYAPEEIAAWSGGIDTDERRERIAQAIQEGTHRHLIAELQGTTVGFGVVAPDEGELRAVYVDPNYGGRGIGGLLLEALEEAALSAGCRRLWLDASLNAEAFYLRHGYVSVGRTSHTFRSGGEIACVRMEKHLSERGRVPSER